MSSNNLRLAWECPRLNAPLFTGIFMSLYPKLISHRDSGVGPQQLIDMERIIANSAL